MLVGTVFASCLLSTAAEARGQVGNNGDLIRFGGGYTGVEGRSDKRGWGRRYRSTSQSGYGYYNSRCYFPAEWQNCRLGPPSVIKHDPPRQSSFGLRRWRSQEFSNVAIGDERGPRS